ncbi:hypothetical protein ACOSQ3_023718 [Xanthoceras sorbifolium]
MLHTSIHAAPISVINSCSSSTATPACEPVVQTVSVNPLDPPSHTAAPPRTGNACFHVTLALSLSREIVSFFVLLLCPFGVVRSSSSSSSSHHQLLELLQVKREYCWSTGGVDVIKKHL